MLKRRGCWRAPRPRLTSRPSVCVPQGVIACGDLHHPLHLGLPLIRHMFRSQGHLPHQREAKGAESAESADAYHEQRPQLHRDHRREQKEWLHLERFFGSVEVGAREGERGREEGADAAPLQTPEHTLQISAQAGEASDCKLLRLIIQKTFDISL